MFMMLVKGYFSYASLYILIHEMYMISDMNMFCLKVFMWKAFYNTSEVHELI